MTVRGVFLVGNSGSNSTRCSNSFSRCRSQKEVELVVKIVVEVVDTIVLVVVIVVVYSSSN